MHATFYILFRLFTDLLSSSFFLVFDRPAFQPDVAFSDVAEEAKAPLHFNYAMLATFSGIPMRAIYLPPCSLLATRNLFFFLPCYFHLLSSPLPSFFLPHIPPIAHLYLPILSDCITAPHQHSRRPDTSPRFSSAHP